MAKGIVRKRKAKSVVAQSEQDSKEDMSRAEACSTASMVDTPSSEDKAKEVCVPSGETQAANDVLHTEAAEAQEEALCAAQRLTDEEIVEGIVTAVEAEDIHFLVKIDFCISPHLVTKIPNIEKLVVFLSANLNTEHKLKAIQLIKTLLRSVNLSDPRPLIANLRAASVDYTRLFYLKGKIEFMKRRLPCKEQKPEVIVRE